MKFINTLRNTVRLADIDRNIPYLGDDTVQELQTDLVLKSQHFQQLVVKQKFVIVEATQDRIEQNLIRLVDGVNIQTPEVTRAEVVFRAHVHSQTGYAKANRNLLLGLARLGVRVVLDPIHPVVEGLNEMELQPLNMLTQPWSEKAILIHSTVPTFSQEQDNDFRYRILNTTVEAATIPQQFVDACNAYDEVWTVSDFCREVFEKHGVTKPITVIPNSVETSLYNDKAKPHRVLPQLKSFVFVSVFGWNWRKGYDALLKAFLTEFDAEDDVSLLMVVRYQYDEKKRRRFKIEDDIKAYVKKYGGSSPPHVARCGRTVPEYEMPRLYRACNCFVLPSRGEGFGLPYMEAGLCGLPVIATRFGGQLMFLNDDNAYLLEVDEISAKNSEKTEIHYWEGQEFAQLTSDATIGELGGLMRKVYEDYPAAVRKNQLLNAAAAEAYNCPAIAQLAEERIAQIWKSL